MATTAKTVETELQNRLRIGTAEKAITDANLYLVMHYTQRLLNYALGRVRSTGTYTAASTTTVLSDATSSIAADCLAVISMYTDNKSVYKCPNWQSIQQYDSSWRGAGATESLIWSAVGRNMLAVYPASSKTYNVVYIKDTTTVDSSADAFNIPDADIILLEDLCEIVWLIHLRHIPEATLKIQRAAENFQAMKGVVKIGIS